MLDPRMARFFFVLCALLAAPRLAAARPPVSLGTLEVRGTVAAPLPVVVMRSEPTVPAPALENLPVDARSPYVVLQRATAERSQIMQAVRARGLSGTALGPTQMEIVQREETARSRLRRALERNVATLSADGWLLLGELRNDEASERFERGVAERTATTLTPARAAYAQAAARGGTSATGLWARLRESAIAMELDELVAAQSALAVVIANSPPGALRATALVQQADLDGGSLAAGLYARALAEGADAPLRTYVRFATMLSTRFTNPIAARDAGVLILTEGDDATAELAAPIIGELLIRTGDPGGFSLTAEVAPERAARVLAAAAEAALAARERGWAELALTAASGRAPSSAGGRAATARIASLSSEPPIPRDTLPQWLLRQATRCQSDVLSADSRNATGDFDVLVRRQRGLLRVIARARPGAGAGALRFKHCIEGELPDPPALDSSTIYQGALRVR